MARRNLLDGIGKVPANVSDASRTSSTMSSRQPSAIEVDTIARSARRSMVAPSRVGRKALTVHVDEEVRVRLKILAAQERTTVEAIMHEAIGLVFEQRSKTPSKK